MLISNGADVNKTVKSTGWTPIDIASMNGKRCETNKVKDQINEKSVKSYLVWFVFRP